MADDLGDFPIVVLENDSPEAIGKVGLFDYLMFVGRTGMSFTAAVPGLLMPWGPVFTAVVQHAARVRAASTLAQMGLIKGDTFEFIRLALELSQQDVATMYGVTLATVIGWEDNTIPIPRANWVCLAQRICIADGRSVPNGLSLTPNFRPRLIRVFPNLPLFPESQPTSPACPPPIVPCIPPRNPLC